MYSDDYREYMTYAERARWEAEECYEALANELAFDADALCLTHIIPRDLPRLLAKRPYPRELAWFEDRLAMESERFHEEVYPYHMEAFAHVY